jgi:hypothetical protein
MKGIMMMGNGDDRRAIGERGVGVDTMEEPCYNMREWDRTENQDGKSFITFLASRLAL